MDPDQLGRLERVDLRTVWKTEAQSFTPWLADSRNLAFLGETLGLDLELDSTEKEVGPFRADILCKDTGSGDWVLIENQIERTDHTHLGQILTYAAGLRAVTVVWVARKFTEEHRSAVDWLNEISSEEFRFFGVEVELWRIGGSDVAPKFNVVSKPDEWERSLRSVKTGLTETQRLQMDFWASFREDMVAKSTIRFAKPAAQNWISHALGRSGLSLQSVFSPWNSAEQAYSGGEVRAEFVIDHPQAQEYYEQLAQHKDVIEEEVGAALTWHESQGRSRRIYLRRDAQVKDRSTWPELHEWLRINLEKLREVFQPWLSRLGNG